MTLAEAKRILHPDTSREALIGYNRVQGVEMVKEACIVACEAIDKLEEIKRWMEQYAEDDLR